MSEPFIGEIQIFGFNFSPRGWAFCNGATLPIAQNTALFSLLGVTYGGNGQTTFQLPNLAARTPIGQGQGPGLTPRASGEVTGAPSVTLTVGQLPAHSHPQAVHTANANTGTPSSAVTPAVTTSAAYGSAASMVAMNDSVGGGQPHPNEQPYLGLNFCIALQGVYPSFP